MMKNFSIIVAFDAVRGIGRGGVMPWHLSADLKHFRDITTDALPGMLNAVIMGRKTWESIPSKFRPLPGRRNIVITAQADYLLPPDVLRAGSFLEALAFAGDASFVDAGKVFVVGGGRVFAEAIKHAACQRLYMTYINHVFDCDVFFPDIPSSFVEVARSENLKEGGLSFYFVCCDRSM